MMGGVGTPGEPKWSRGREGGPCVCVCVCARTCVWCTGVCEEAACRMLLPDMLLVQPVCYLPGTGVWGPGSADLCMGRVHVVRPGDGGLVLCCRKMRVGLRVFSLVSSRCCHTRKGQADGQGPGLGDRQDRRAGRGFRFPAALEATSGFRSLQLGRRRGGPTSRSPAEGEG